MKSIDNLNQKFKYTALLFVSNAFIAILEGTSLGVPFKNCSKRSNRIKSGVCRSFPNPVYEKENLLTLRE